MAGYSHKTWTCPFFTFDEPRRVHCEAGRIGFPDRPTANGYMNRFCAGGNGWQKCSLACALVEYYEGK